MKFFRTIRNYLCSCGIDKDLYKSVKKNAYISNFEVWRFLHILMDVLFAALFTVAMINDFVGINKWFYLGALVYSGIATIFFFILRKDSLGGQLLIYLSMSVMFLFAAFITQNKPETPAISFMAFILIAPMFMIDKTYFMIIELVAASSIFLGWMYVVKPHDIWMMDLVNTIIYTIVGIFIHIIACSIRIKEFVLIRKINMQKDIDELTGLKNKAALTRAINKFVKDENDNKGIFIVLDIDYFKKFNDTYGHDMGDSILHQLGAYFRQKFVKDEIVGRFGGDEFIIFIKNAYEEDYAKELAMEIVNETRDAIKLPSEEPFSVSMGIAIYRGTEQNYSAVFKKADIALYKTKANRKIKYSIYEEE